MIESLEHAKEELKRVDHLIYVSLKYTRTTDVLKNVLYRMVEYYDFLIEGMLRYLVDKHVIFEEPAQPVVKANTVKKYFEDETIKKHMDYYILFKKVLKREDYESEQMFRKNVSLIVDIEGEEIRVNIEYVTEHFKELKEVFKVVREKILEEEKQ